MKRNPWPALLVAVVAIDVLQIATHNPTLSAAFRSAVRHPVRRWPTLIAFALVSSHLFTGKP